MNGIIHRGGIVGGADTHRNGVTMPGRRGFIGLHQSAADLHAREAGGPARSGQTSWKSLVSDLPLQVGAIIESN
jgi:hypothetical protein